ncbi:MAG TPA: hypothetical protein DIU06_03445, partial [Rhodospirillaceae bacterium]|nr:hypothetical protein [Rhodospirillaceae bacterium]
PLQSGFFYCATLHKKPFSFTYITLHFIFSGSIVRHIPVDLNNALKTAKNRWTTTMKYSEITQESYSDQIGTVNVMGQSVQLCDHVENIDGQYYATSFVLSANDRKMLKDQGAQFGTIGQEDLSAIYLTEDLLEMAQPVRENDQMTQDMIARLMGALQSMNVKTYAHSA